MHVPTNVSPLEPQAVPDQGKDENLTHEKVLRFSRRDLCVLEAEASAQAALGKTLGKQVVLTGWGAGAANAPLT